MEFIRTTAQHTLLQAWSIEDGSQEKGEGGSKAAERDVLPQHVAAAWSLGERLRKNCVAVRQRSISVCPWVWGEGKGHLSREVESPSAESSSAGLEKGPL